RRARDRRARADAAGARDALPALLDALAPPGAAALPARPGTVDAGRVPLPRGARGVRRRAPALAPRRRARRAGRRGPARLDLRRGRRVEGNGRVQGPEGAWPSARAAGAEPRRAPGLDLPLVRPVRAAGASRRLLDDRAAGGGAPLAAALEAELRRLAPRRRRAAAAARRPLPRPPPPPDPGHPPGRAA